ncbi:hypothetical protein CRD60_00590 [Bifidobacterium aemilianum]|uniref:DUF3027 domain-containing protein n=1 Tax=Bifidobacterium aemilianum TaxID=2493120 RepID=A0A366KAY1_9BIFI|nr:DUF3027 domain-containing protein [Bifidobacterium aemilianum]RBP98402.1 hypothetical protein CRD60_00590 [Bifidobacterium aemilianum]
MTGRTSKTVRDDKQEDKPNTRPEPEVAEYESQADKKGAQPLVVGQGGDDPSQEGQAYAALEEGPVDPQDLARTVARAVADLPEQVGDFAQAVVLEGQVTDFRFECLIRGYEGWQWSVTLFHDSQADRWTVDETSLIPSDKALRPPAWVPWKDRLLASDLSVTDSIGTDPDDPRLEEGFRLVKPKGKQAPTKDTEDTGETGQATGSAERGASPDGHKGPRDSSDAAEAVEAADNQEDLLNAVRDFELSRRHVLSPLGRQQTAKRWYEGQRGPKSLSTKTAGHKHCDSCGFMVPLVGELGQLFGVCANKWSPDDGRVVSLDHGCGEHSEIEPPETSHLWIQSDPAYDDMHIDIVEGAPRDEHSQLELIEELDDTESDMVDEAGEATEHGIQVGQESESASARQSESERPAQSID